MAAYDEKDKKDNFNSRPSARGDVIMITKGFPQRVFQFTPLREGRRVRVLVAAIIGAISIHAPPRGATCVFSNDDTVLKNFNSRPSARGDFRAT